MAQNGESQDQSKYEYSFDSEQQSETEETTEYDFSAFDSDTELEQPETEETTEYDFSAFESDTELEQPETEETTEGDNPFAGGGESSGGNPFAGGGNPFAGGGESSGGNPFAGGGESSGDNPFAGGGNPFAGGGESSGDNPFAGGGASGFGNPLAPAEGYEFDFSGVAGEGESGMNTPWDELLQFDEFDNVADIIDGENPFAGDEESSEGSNPFAVSGEGTDTGVGNTDNGNSNQFFGDNNQANGNGNWYVSEETELPDNLLEGDINPEVLGLFGGEEDSISGNNPAFAGGGIPSFVGGAEPPETSSADGNQTDGSGNWNFGSENTTDGNGNWEVGDGNQTEGNANWNLGDGNTVTGNGNRPSGDGNDMIGNGNQPTGDNNQINGNRVSTKEDNQNIVGNGDRYFLMDESGNIFLVNDESAGDSNYQFDFEFLGNSGGEESGEVALDQPFVQELFSQFADGNTMTGGSPFGGGESSGGGNPFAGSGAPSGGGSPFGGGESSGGGNPFVGSGAPSGGGNPFGGGESSGGETGEGSDLEEQLRQSPFGRLLDLEGVDGAEDIFGGLQPPSGEGDSEGGGPGGSNPFAFWDPVTEGNPFTPEDDMPANEGVSGDNPFAGGGNPFAGGGDSEGDNPFAGGGDSEGGNPFAGGDGEVPESPWDELLQFDEFDSVEDILSDGGEVTFDSQGGNPFAGGGNPFAGGGNSEGETSESPWDELLQFDEFDSVEDILSDGAEATPNSDDEAAPEYDFSAFEDSDDGEAAPESFAESPVGDLLNFPGVESPADIFETFNDDSENALANWNPFTDGNPFVVGDENTDEPVLNAEGDTIVVENQFGYILQDSENQFYISENDLIDEDDVRLGEDNGFSEGFPFSNDFSGAENIPAFEDIPFEGEELTIETDNEAYLLRDGDGNWVVSSDETVSSEDLSLSLGSSFGAENPFLEDSNDLSELLSSLMGMETSGTEG